MNDALPADATPREIPGDRGWPVIGNSLDLFRIDRAVHEWFDRYGEVSWTNLLGARWIQLLGPDANQFVLQNRGELFASGPAWEYLLAKFFHRGLMLLDFDEHRLHRRIMQGAFHQDALAGYLRLMNPRIEATLSGWDLARFRAFDRFKALTLDLGSIAFIGRPPGGGDAARINRAFLDTVRAPTDILRLPIPGTRWWRGLRGRRVLEEFFRRELPAKRAAGGTDLFARLCAARDEDGRQFSDEDVINHMIFVLMAAHDTSTITLTNMVYQLAKHPAWQERLREESRALGQPLLEHGDLGRLEAMTWVMKEALRLCAPLPGMPRRATRDCEYKGFRIREGDLVNISVWFTHTSPRFWSEPERFDPERFSDARAEDRRHPFQWIPFGGGAHKCIGLHFGEMEVKAILHALLLRYRWSVPQGYAMRQDFTSLPIPKDRLPLRLERL